MSLPVTPPESLCLLRLSAIGDCCHTLALVRALQRGWPQTRITWIVGRTEHGLLEGINDVEFLVYDKRDGIRGYRRLQRALWRRRFQLLIHAHASMRANLVSLLVQADVRLGFDRARARDFQWLFTNNRIQARQREHVLDGLLGFARHLGITDLEPRWQLPVPDAAQEFAAGVLPPDRPSLVISPCSGQRARNYRNWSIANYAAIADYASEHLGAQVLLTGGHSELERFYAHGILSQANCQPVDLTGQTSLPELAALLRQATVVLCPDSGPAHIATALGTPVVGLYATSDRHRTGPYHSQHLVADAYPELCLREFGKAATAVRFGRRIRDPEAMLSITVAAVQEKLSRAFAEAANPA